MNQIVGKETDETQQNLVKVYPLFPRCRMPITTRLACSPTKLRMAYSFTIHTPNASSSHKVEDGITIQFLLCRKGSYLMMIVYVHQNMTNAAVQLDIFPSSADVIHSSLVSIRTSASQSPKQCVGLG